MLELTLSSAERKDHQRLLGALLVVGDMIALVEVPSLVGAEASCLVACHGVAFRNA